MARTSRARAAAAANRTSLPPDHGENDNDDTPTPHQVELGDELAENITQKEDVDNEGTPAVESDPDSGPSSTQRGITTLRKRRGGRGLKRVPSRREAQEDNDHDPGSDAGTPRRRGGWRGRGYGAGRWAKAKGGPSHITQVPLDKEGNMANVRDDEVELPKDPEGEEKVDENGYLQSGREYRVRTFRIEGKGERLYMLSTEPARCIGFRDSYLFFQKHKQLYKIILAEEAKKDLIERNLIPHSYKGRAIGVVTARSVFREFGSKIIIGGRKIIDDYQVAAARVQGEIEGEYAVPEDNVPIGGNDYDRNRYVAWHGASSVYHNGTPSLPVGTGRPGEGKKRKVVVTGANWMFEHAREASRFNTVLAANRRQNLTGAYNVHTNNMQYPVTMQPTHARWQQISPFPSNVQSVQLIPTSHDEVANDSAGQGNVDTFSGVSQALMRNFLVTDTYYETPSTPTIGFPGPDEAVLDVGCKGLTHISDEVLIELPDDCRIEFDKARAEEARWKESWRSEGYDHARANSRITYNI